MNFTMKRLRAEWLGGKNTPLPEAQTANLIYLISPITEENAMNHSTLQTAKQKLMDEFGTVISEAEQLLESVANEGGEQVKSLRAKIKNNLFNAKERLQNFEELALENTRAAARATNEYAHKHPWHLIGAVAGVGVALALIMRRR